MFNIEVGKYNQKNPGKAEDISFGYGIRTIAKWKNQKIGSIVELNNDNRVYFLEYDILDENGEIDHDKFESIMHGEQEDQKPLFLAEGFVIHWLKESPSELCINPSPFCSDEDRISAEKKRTGEIFDEYYNKLLNEYVETHMQDPDEWNRDLKKEFAEIALDKELEKIEKSEAIYPYLCDKDAETLREIVQQYLKYLEKRTGKKVEKDGTELENKQYKNPDMPQPLVNTIFAERIKVKEDEREVEYEIDYEKLWNWINDNFVYNLKNQYEWTALWLFSKENKLLKEAEISNINFADAITAWFPKAKKKCVADYLGTYRNGYISSNKFKYRSWLKSDNPSPAQRDLINDQTKTGFERIQKLCNSYLEVEFEGENALQIVKIP